MLQTHIMLQNNSRTGPQKTDLTLSARVDPDVRLAAELRYILV